MFVKNQTGELRRVPSQIFFFHTFFQKIWIFIISLLLVKEWKEKVLRKRKRGLENNLVVRYN